jgi:hypothetical protein
MNAVLLSALVTTQRLARLRRWLGLTVLAFVTQLLAQLAPQAASRTLTRHARILQMLLVASALKQTARRTRHPTSRIEMRRLTIRGVCGGALRRTLRDGTLRDRANTICAILNNPTRWIAILVRRLQRRFTKLGRLPAAPCVLVRRAAHAPFFQAHALNSS